MKRVWIIVGIILGVVIILGAGYIGFRSSQQNTPVIPETPSTIEATTCDVMQTVTAPGMVFNTEEIILRLPIAGRVEEILVQPGEQVAAGDSLARISAGDVALAIAQAQLDVVNAQVALEKVEATRYALGYPRSDDLTIERAQILLAAAEDRYQQAQTEYTQAAKLSETDPIRLAAMENLFKTKHERNQIAASLKWLTSDSDDTEVAISNAEVAIAKGKLMQAQETLTLLENMFKQGETTGAVMNSPVDGIVVEVKAHANDELSSGSEIIILVNPNALVARVTILEEDYPYVSVGQQVELFFDALPDQEVTGTVDRVVPQRTSSDRPTYYVYVTLDRIPEHLVEGMTVDSAIIIAQRQQVLCLPRALVRASSGETAIVKVWNGITSEEREINLGLRGDVYIEIVSGLDEGEQVVAK